MHKRLTGLLIILTASVGLTMVIGGIIFVYSVLDRPTAFFEEQLAVLTDSIETLSDAVDTAANSIDTASDTLETLQSLTLGLTDVVSNTHPALESADKLVTADLPDKLRAIQDTIPSLQQSADAVDRALIQVIEFEAQVANLGLISTTRIQYEPETMLGEAVSQLGHGLQGLPERLISIGPDIDQVEQELLVVQETILAIDALSTRVTQDLDKLAESIDKFDTLIARLDSLTDDLGTQVTPRLDLIKPLAIIFLVWLGLSQSAPLYLGIQLLKS